MYNVHGNDEIITIYLKMTQEFIILSHFCLWIIDNGIKNISYQLSIN